MLKELVAYKLTKEKPDMVLCPPTLIHLYDAKRDPVPNPKKQIASQIKTKPTYKQCYVGAKNKCVVKIEKIGKLEEKTDQELLAEIKEKIGEKEARTLAAHCGQALTEEGMYKLFAEDKGPKMLKYACWNIRGNKSIVKKACNKDGMCLAYGSDEMHNDEEVCLAAIKQNPEAVKFVGDDLKTKEDFVSKAKELGAKL